MEPRIVAIHLPQFHRVPENDQWWGDGFTEWNNVRRGKSWFPGHRQPLEPGELGYYDLLDPSVRSAQADLAREHGIHGFCYYHYWFHGRRLLERPVEEILESGSPDYPFCLAWANEPWTRAWDGGERQILMAQEYSEEDHREHARHLGRFFADPRYIRIQGRPVFLVYRSTLIPQIQSAVRIWRDVWEPMGFPQPYLVRMESNSREGGDPSEVGMDASMEFQPAWREMRFPDNFWKRSVLRVFGKRIPAVFDYPALARKMARRTPPSWVRFPGATPMWDNTCRRGERGLVLKGSTPGAYGDWLDSCLDKAASLPVDDPLVFVNAWNEWGEGCHLEPDLHDGRSYLVETLARGRKPRRS